MKDHVGLGVIDFAKYGLQRAHVAAVVGEARGQTEHVEEARIGRGRQGEARHLGAELE